MINPNPTCRFCGAPLKCMLHSCETCLNLGKPAPCKNCPGGIGWPCLVDKNGQHVHPDMAACKQWEARGVPEGVRLTIEAGIVCGDFGDFHEWAERLLGHPVWTHEFAIEEVWDDLKIALVAWDEGAPYGQRRKAGPVETLMKLAPDKPIIAIGFDAEVES